MLTTRNRSAGDQAVAHDSQSWTKCPFSDKISEKGIRKKKYVRTSVSAAMPALQLPTHPSTQSEPWEHRVPRNRLWSSRVRCLPKETCCNFSVVVAESLWRFGLERLFDGSCGTHLPETFE